MQWSRLTVVLVAIIADHGALEAQQRISTASRDHLRISRCRQRHKADLGHKSNHNGDVKRSRLKQLAPNLHAAPNRGHGCRGRTFHAHFFDSCHRFSFPARDLWRFLANFRRCMTSTLDPLPLPFALFFELPSSDAPSAASLSGLRTGSARGHSRAAEHVSGCHEQRSHAEHDGAVSTQAACATGTMQPATLCSPQVRVP